MSERIRSITAGAVIGLSLLVVVVVLSVDPSGSGDRVHHLASRLKCPVCTSESIADSPAQVSRDLLTLIEEQVAEGRSDGDIITFFVDRYGDEVLLDPPASNTTWALWMAPLIALGVGGTVIAGRRRRDDRQPTESERALVQEALEEQQ